MQGALILRPIPRGEDPAGWQRDEGFRKNPDRRSQGRRKLSECLPVSPGNHNREGTIVGDQNKGGETTWTVWKEMEVTVPSPRGSCTAM